MGTLTARDRLERACRLMSSGPAYRQAEREADIEWRRELVRVVNREQNPFRRAEYAKLLAAEHREDEDARRIANDLRIAFARALAAR